MRDNVNMFHVLSRGGRGSKVGVGGSVVRGGEEVEGLRGCSWERGGGCGGEGCGW